MEVVTLVVSIVSAVGAMGAALYARGQARSAAKSADAAERSATADQTTAALDVQRRHDELTPHFQVTLKKPDAGAEKLHLSLFLNGPSALGRLDGLTVKILDDRTLHEFGTRLAASHGDPERVDDQIWAA